MHLFRVHLKSPGCRHAENMHSLCAAVRVAVRQTEEQFKSEKETLSPAHHPPFVPLALTFATQSLLRRHAPHIAQVGIFEDKVQRRPDLVLSCARTRRPAVDFSEERLSVR